MRRGKWSKDLSGQSAEFAPPKKEMTPAVVKAREETDTDAIPGVIPLSSSALPSGLARD
jgi:hypothetical protein